MEVKELQKLIAERASQMSNKFNTGTEIMLALTEELGEVAQEVALFEEIGTKAGWQKEPDEERLSEEITQVINLLFTLSNFYKIDLSEKVASNNRGPCGRPARTKGTNSARTVVGQRPRGIDLY